MDWIKIRNVFSERFEKYKYVLLIIALGIFLMSLPASGESHSGSDEPERTVSTESIGEKLEKILTQIQGVGKVQVLITELSGAETVYQIDEERTEGEDREQVESKTVIVSGGGVQTGLIQTVTPPTYLGAIVVCQGAKNPTVRLAVANAVSAVTGISMDRISVLEMK